MKNVPFIRDRSNFNTLQPENTNMAMCFWYLVKSDLSCVVINTTVWAYTKQFTFNKEPENTSMYNWSPCLQKSVIQPFNYANRLNFAPIKNNPLIPLMKLNVLEVNENMPCFNRHWLESNFRPLISIRKNCLWIFLFIIENFCKMKFSKERSENECSVFKRKTWDTG